MNTKCNKDLQPLYLIIGVSMEICKEGNNRDQYHMQYGTSKYWHLQA